LAIKLKAKVVILLAKTRIFKQKQIINKDASGVLATKESSTQGRPKTAIALQRFKTKLLTMQPKHNITYKQVATLNATIRTVK
jgi:hypothetical protein